MVVFSCTESWLRHFVERQKKKRICSLFRDRDAKLQNYFQFEREREREKEQEREKLS